MTVNNYAVRAITDIRYYLASIERISLRDIEIRVVELYVRDKVAALGCRWGGVLLGPQEIKGALEQWEVKGELFKEVVSVADEDTDHPPLDIGLLVCICSNASQYCITDC